MVRLLVLIFVFFFGLQAQASDCGIFKVVKGKVTYQKKSTKKFKKARINKKICQGDLVKTGPDSRTKIVMADSNEINVSPDTELKIEVYQGGKKAVLNVLNGKVRSNVKNKYKDSNASHYRVKTKSAVAGVRGTEFMASYSRRTNQSKVVTFEGEVMVGKVQGGRITNRVSVKPGQYTSNKPGTDPHPAKEVPPAELAQLDKDTNVGGDSASGSKQPASQPKAEDKKEEPKADEPKAEEPKQESNPEPANSDKQAGNNDSGGSTDGGGRAPASVDDSAAGGGVDSGLDEISDRSGERDDIYGDDPYHEDDSYGDPNFEGDNAGDGTGGRDVASIDGAEPGEIELPPPSIDDMPGGEDLTGIDAPKIPTFDNPGIVPVVECQTCNNAVINQKVKVTIIPVLPGQ